MTAEGAAGDHASIQVICPTQQVVSVGPKFLKYFNPILLCMGLFFIF
jgi:hypothetical protein